MHLCHHLRWKGYLGSEDRSRAELIAMAQLNLVPFHCLRTCRNWGPDDGPATIEGCTPERDCYEDSKRFPAAVS